MSAELPNVREVLDLAERVAANPDAVGDADKLRHIADYLDMDDRRHGISGTDMQDFLRALALRFDVGSTP